MADGSPKRIEPGPSPEFHWKWFNGDKFLMLNVHSVDLAKLIDLNLTGRVPSDTDRLPVKDKQVQPRVAQIEKELAEDDGPPQRSEEWLQLRRNLITASDFAAALGQNKYCSEQKLLWRKAGTRVVERNAALTHGTVYEDEALAVYCKLFNEQVLDSALRQHPDHLTKIGGSPDGFAKYSGRLLEVKCPHSRKITAECPEMYMAQCLGLCEIFDVDVVDFIQYKPPTMFNRGVFCVVTLSRDRAWWSLAVPKLLKFVDDFRHRRALIEAGDKGACEMVAPAKPRKVKRQCVRLNEDLEAVGSTFGNL